MNFVSDVERRGIARVSSPRYCGNIVGFVVCAIYGNKQIGNFSLERRGAINGRFANVAFEFDDVGGILVALAKLSYKHPEHQFTLAVNNLVVTSKLSD